MMPVDRFSGHADLYAQYRIDYPADLYDVVLSRVTQRNVAWDCATGNGQVAGALAAYFDRVEATDISEKQLAQAVHQPNIHYQVSMAEQTPFSDQTFDLITVAQALHWFNVPAFHEEVRRVAKPGAAIAEWGYGMVQVSAQLDPIILDFYRNVIGPYWDPQRRYVDGAYATLPFPFDQAEHHNFVARRSWSLDRFLNYLRTWSAVRQYLYENEEDPVTALGDRLKPLWTADEQDVQFPIFLRIGRI
ncbi:Methyltransferase type 11 [Fibrisoma limi BUZ 3]|uniref:Methyltransferase type 11 n=1 Tax=Fibrisoma limi BUZ 3 TaxID=1185876 RepID=I2GNY0_9BACT|nr:class I SAM-dependent methyltransferase [Fibrisoma limi]CCH55608.1 Methyltransferase type 11 [Fibrisoma limi BUZ 3]